MDNQILGLIEELEEIVDRGTKVPMTGKVLVDDSAIFALLDKIRSSLPEEIRNAQWIMEERQRIVEEAQAEAQKMMERAKQYAEKLAEEDAIVSKAQEYAEDIAKQAQTFSRDVKIGTVQYSDEVLQFIEKKLAEQMESVRRNREELRTMVKRDDREPKMEAGSKKEGQSKKDNSKE